jgi:hypothetical protein
VKLGILNFLFGCLPTVLPTDNWILIFLIIPSVIPPVIFNLNFEFNQKILETVKYHRRLFNPSVMPSVIFNLNFSENRQITLTTFQSVSDFFCKEQ